MSSRFVPLWRDQKVLDALIQQACQILNHDNDVLHGTEPHNQWAKKELRDRFSKILKREVI